RTAPGTRKLVQLGTRVVEFRFARSRRRTIGISVDAEGLAVAAPYFAPWTEIERFLLEKTRWITGKLDEWSQAGRPLRVAGAAGESIPLHGRLCTLDVAEGPKRIELAGDRLVVQLRRAHERARVKADLVRWLKARALETLAPRVVHYAGILGLGQPRVAVSNARTQWGVCTQDGRIRLSWRLVHVAPELADYVVAHEVAHLVELNHSARFWKVVESLYPDCRAARRNLDLAAAALPIF
ncbi:unnamed protein product, partial [Phaeothamnion confervicola]